MTQRCEIVGRAVYDQPGNFGAGTGHVVYECITHGMPMAPLLSPGRELCPIGRIEEATEAALQKIREAQR